MQKWKNSGCALAREEGGGRISIQKISPSRLRHEEEDGGAYVVGLEGGGRSQGWHVRKTMEHQNNQTISTYGAMMPTQSFGTQRNVKIGFKWLNLATLTQGGNEKFFQVGKFWSPFSPFVLLLLLPQETCASNASPPPLPPRPFSMQIWGRGKDTATTRRGTYSNHSLTPPEACCVGETWACLMPIFFFK